MSPTTTSAPSETHTETQAAHVAKPNCYVCQLWSDELPLHRYWIAHSSGYRSGIYPTAAAALRAAAKAGYRQYVRRGIYTVSGRNQTIPAKYLPKSKPSVAPCRAVARPHWTELAPTDLIY